ncbi:MAG: pyridoxamine 5'-phosphate oxidase family protein [Clostridia bacterium]|nr:pyridoxamine 5'-phosphate oxidase family protein [Clostridia bacterium]MBQ4606135.1 pyridoxamine 5'-phosphate oxidase family protein [Clostridia bacterium]
MQEVYEFLKTCGTYFLATVEGDQPRVRPFGTVDLFEGKLYIQTGKRKAVAQQMKANPKVEISAMAPDGRWIRIAAEAVADDNLAAQTHMLDAYPSLKAMYQPGDGNTEVYYLQNATAQICSFTAAPVCITF